MSTDSSKTHYKDVLEGLIAGQHPDEKALESAFSSILSGQWTEVQVAGFLVSLRFVGVSGPMLAAGAKVLRQLAVTVPPGDLAALRPFGDNCGTGGDGAHSFNISTAAAIVAASGGAKIAKHGNRSVSSLCGSADLLFALGYPEHLTISAATELLRQTGLTFFFAPAAHPALKRLAPVRRSLGIPTLFNLLGPLASPVAPDTQLIGVSQKSYLRPMAEAMLQLGIKTGLVVHSRDGLDELSPGASSDALLISEGQIRPLIVDPKEFGVQGSLADLKGGHAAVNSGLMTRLLVGDKELAPLIDTVSLNGGALLWIMGQEGSLVDGFKCARDLIYTGRGMKFFDAWIQSAQKMGERSIK